MGRSSSKGSRNAGRDARVSPESKNPHGEGEVDNYVAERHRALGASAAFEDSEDENEAPLVDPGAVGVMNLSSSEEGSDSESEEEGKDKAEGWGGRRRDYYGGDAEDYEVMDVEEREEVLGAEEEEAVKKQKVLLEGMEEGDFGEIDNDDDDEDADDESADEVEKLVKEGEESVGGMVVELRRVWTEIGDIRKMDDESLGRMGVRVRLDILFSYCQCLLYYIGLMADPEYKMDHKWHPVVSELVRLRNLDEKTKSFVNSTNKTTRSNTEAAKQKGHVAIEQRKRKGSNKAVDVERETLKPAVQQDGNNQENSKVPPSVDELEQERNRNIASKTFVDEDDDDEFMNRVMGKRSKRSESEVEKKATKKSRKLNQIVSKLERGRQAKRRAGEADVDHDPVVVRNDSWAKSRESEWEGGRDQAREHVTEEEKALREHLRGEKVLKKAGKGEGHVYTYDDRVGDNERRKATKQVLSNRGLVAARPKAKRNPRMKHKGSFTKAKKRRRGAVRDVITNYNASNYAGEATGINPRARRSTNL